MFVWLIGWVIWLIGCLLDRWIDSCFYFHSLHLDNFLGIRLWKRIDFTAWLVDWLVTYSDSYFALAQDTRKIVSGCYVHYFRFWIPYHFIDGLIIASPFHWYCYILSDPASEKLHPDSLLHARHGPYGGVWVHFSHHALVPWNLTWWKWYRKTWIQIHIYEWRFFVVEYRESSIRRSAWFWEGLIKQKTQKCPGAFKAG